MTRHSALKALALVALGALCASEARGEILTEEVLVQKVQQRYPWNGLVDIELSSGDLCLSTELEPVLTLVVTNMSTGAELTIETLTLNGEAFTNSVSVVPNADVHLVWDASADVEAETMTDNAELSVSVTHKKAEYMVVDVSGGTSATSYPVTYLSEPPSDGWADEYKTTKIVLRRIPAGTAMLGSPSDEKGRATNETQHTVTLTSDFWIGVFEVTQTQYTNVVAVTNPATNKGDMRPVETVSYNTIVGDAGPISNLVSKTDLAFTLPTDAQWEYACRAGTEGAWNNGTTITNESRDANLALLGRYFYNDGYGGNSTTVGSYQPNTWGLYDMHGNVSEWCLDGEMSYSESDDVTDPVGEVFASSPYVHGGGYNSFASACRSAIRTLTYASRTAPYMGFRLACPMKQNNSSF